MPSTWDVGSTPLAPAFTNTLSPGDPPIPIRPGGTSVARSMETETEYTVFGCKPPTCRFRYMNRSSLRLCPLNVDAAASESLRKGAVAAVELVEVLVVVRREVGERDRPPLNVLVECVAEGGFVPTLCQDR